MESGLSKSRSQKKNIQRTKRREKQREAATKIQSVTRRNLVVNSMKPTTKATKLIQSYVKSKNIYKKKQNEQKINLVDQSTLIYIYRIRLIEFMKRI